MWIDTEEKLSVAIADLLETEVVAVDTEYDSFHYFYEKLCLLQVGTHARCYLVDPLEAIDVGRLGVVFSHPQIVKVFHAGNNDIRLLRRNYGFTVRAVFDTAKAASLLGESHLSLKTLVSRYLGVEVEKPKSIQRSRWDKRPLTEEQIAYARLDIKHLAALYSRLRGELAQAGLEKEAQKSFERVAQATWQEKIFDPEGYRRLAGYDELTPGSEERLRALYRWRYEKAKDLDRAVFMILSDRELIAAALGGVGWLSASERGKRWGKELVAILGTQP